MPAEILLPLFALTLLANAVLVAFAIRGLRRGSTDQNRAEARDQPRRSVTPGRAAPKQPMTAQLTAAIAARRALADSAQVAAVAVPVAVADLATTPIAVAPVASAPISAAPVPVAPIATTPSSVPAGPAAGATSAPASAGSASSAPGSEPAKRKPPAADRTPTRPRKAAAESGRRSRRRFSLPPLDDDHEKVSRSIETFLAGVEPAAGDAASEPGPAAGATTVAMVAVEGLAPPSRRSRSARAGDDDATAAAVAMVERTIRGAARGTDAVTVVERGRFRIVLPATGELAARAYLRRIRATVEPLLESADRPLRLAVATATVLDEPVADAIQRADQRLEAALATLAAPVGHRASEGQPDAGRPDHKVADVAPRAAAD